LPRRSGAASFTDDHVPVRIGLLGCGTVGSATARILIDRRTDLEQRAGQAIDIARIAVRSRRPESVSVPQEVWTNDPWDLVADPCLDVGVELIGGADPALDLSLAALKSDKHVVTANKEVVAAHSGQLFQAA